MSTNQILLTKDRKQTLVTKNLFIFKSDVTMITSTLNINAS